MKIPSLSAIGSVAYKEFLHIYRDRRILVFLLILPPFFTLIFGHAFEADQLTDVPALLVNRDETPRTQRFLDIVTKNKTFVWQKQAPERTDEMDLLGHHVRGALVIPSGWGDSWGNGDPKPVVFYLDGSDTNTATELQGSVQQSLADFQMKERGETVRNLPMQVYDLGAKLPVQSRKEFVSLMEPWTLGNKVLYNPKTRFIDYVVPGIIGLILQLLTVTLMACTIARERESGTLYQLLVTSLQRGEIVIGKMLPYLAISMCLIAVIAAVAGLHFKVPFHNHAMVALIC